MSSKEKYEKNFIYRNKKINFKIRMLKILLPKCQRCGRLDTLEVDHIYPLSYAPHGEFDMNNIQILCKRCNKTKSNTDFTDYRSDADKQKIRKILSYEKIEIYKTPRTILRKVRL